MESRQVYFATNRALVPDDRIFGDEPASSGATGLTFGRVTIDNIDPSKDDSPRFASLDRQAVGAFDDISAREIISSPDSLLVFFHSGATDFRDSMRRAGHLASWYASSGLAASVATVVAFSWPSSRHVIALPPRLPQAAYYTDQNNAANSQFHVALFMRQLDRLIANCRAARHSRKVFLLAHSMGNHALRCGLECVLSQQPALSNVFDETFLIAADEPADIFSPVGHAGFSMLPLLSRRISIYYSRRDVLMWASRIANGGSRMGGVGPVGRDDEGRFPRSIYAFRDCTDIRDYPYFKPLDGTHQYYRKSSTVRDDIAKRMNS